MFSTFARMRAANVISKSIYILLYVVVFYFVGMPFVYAQSKAKSKEAVIVPATDSETKKSAALAYRDGVFMDALPLYLSLQKGDTSNTDFSYKVAMCYLLLNMDHSKAIPFLKQILNRKDAPSDTYLRWGYALHYANRFDEAIAAYVFYKESLKGKPDEFYEVIRQIEMCNNAKELVQHPVDVEFEHLGKMVNSPYQDYNPFVSADESYLVFSTRRPGANGGADEYGVLNADIYFSTMRLGAWIKSKSIGPAINSMNDEEVIGFSQDGSELLIYSNGDDKGLNELYYSKLSGKAFGKMIPFPPSINSPELETGASLSPDGKTLYYSSEGNGVGGRDLFKSIALPDGGWSPAINLGNVINTEFDEDAPSISPDGKTLYFSSKGHNSMGGFDIFESDYNEATDSWSAPQNIGYPINTADDNLYFSLSGQGKHAYISAVRPDGFGDLDIYKVTFKKIADNDNQTLILGKVLDVDSIQEPVHITYQKKSASGILGLYTPNSRTGKFVISSSQGTFILRAVADCFQPFEKEIAIPDIDQPQELSIEIKLIPIQK